MVELFEFRRSKLDCVGMDYFEQEVYLQGVLQTRAQVVYFAKEEVDLQLLMGEYGHPEYFVYITTIDYFAEFEMVY